MISDLFLDSIFHIDYVHFKKNGLACLADDFREPVYRPAQTKKFTFQQLKTLGDVGK